MNDLTNIIEFDPRNNTEHGFKNEEIHDSDVIYFHEAYDLSNRVNRSKYNELRAIVPIFIEYHKQREGQNAYKRIKELISKEIVVHFRNAEGGYYAYLEIENAKKHVFIDFYSNERKPDIKPK